MFFLVTSAAILGAFDAKKRNVTTNGSFCLVFYKPDNSFGIPARLWSENTVNSCEIIEHLYLLHGALITHINEISKTSWPRELSILSGKFQIFSRSSSSVTVDPSLILSSPWLSLQTHQTKQFMDCHRNSGAKTMMMMMAWQITAFSANNDNETHFPINEILHFTSFDRFQPNTHWLSFINITWSLNITNNTPLYCVGYTPAESSVVFEGSTECSNFGLW